LRWIWQRSCQIQRNKTVFPPCRGRKTATRIACSFDGHEAFIVLDQLRSVDQQRLVKRLGAIDAATRQAVLQALAELFAE
jgi:mRNA interferase MazF